MGGALSCSTKNRHYYINIYSSEPNLLQHRPIFEALQLNQADVGRLRKIFRSIDTDNSGEIELLELLMYIDIERTPFTKRVFSIFDDDGSKTVDFKEFVMALWNYCTLGKATLVLFAFDIYDRDSSGELALDEVRAMLKDVYGSSFENNAHAKQILKQLDSLAINRSDGVDVDQFRAFCLKHQAVLYPAFEIQREIQRRILGEEFWNLLSTRRIQLSNQQYLPIGDFMILHINRDVYDKHVIASLTKKNPKQRLKGDAKEVIKATGTRAARMNRSQLKKKDEEPTHPTSPSRRKSTVAVASTDQNESHTGSVRHNRRSFDNVIYHQRSADKKEEELDEFDVSEMSVDQKYSLVQVPKKEGYAPIQEGSYRRRKSVALQRPEGNPVIYPSARRQSMAGVPSVLEGTLRSTKNVESSRRRASII